MTVASDDADGLTVLDGEGHVAERPELAGTRPTLRPREQVFEAATTTAIPAEADAEPVDMNGAPVHHSSFRTGRSSRRNTTMPTTRNPILMAAPTTTLNVSHTSGKKPTR